VTVGGGVGPAGPVVLMGHRARVRAASDRLFSCRAGRYYGLRMKPSPAQRRARASPDPKKSCWARARVEPKKSCFGPAHGPRAKWPSTTATSSARNVHYAIGASEIGHR
jgi:hypothetical protein